MKSVTDFSWNDEVLLSDKPVLVDFWAAWCGPCRKIGPMLEEIELSELGDEINIVKLNTDENPLVAIDYNVMSIPLLMVFKNGVAVQSMLGVRPKDVVTKMIEEVLYG